MDHKHLKTARATAELLSRPLERSDFISPYDPLCGYKREDLERLIGVRRVEELIRDQSAGLVSEMESRLGDGDCVGVTCEIEGRYGGVIFDYVEGLATGERVYLVLVGLKLKWVKEVKVRPPLGAELEERADFEPLSFQRGDRVRDRGQKREGVVLDDEGFGSGYFTRRLVRWADSVLEEMTPALTLEKIDCL